MDGFFLHSHDDLYGGQLYKNLTEMGVFKNDPRKIKSWMVKLSVLFQLFVIRRLRIIDGYWGTKI